LQIIRVNAQNVFHIRGHNVLNASTLANSGIKFNNRLIKWHSLVD